MPKRSVVGPHAAMAGERQVQTGSQAVATDGRHDGNREARDLVKKRLPGEGKVPRRDARERRDFVQLGARGEGFCVGRDHHTLK